MQEFFTNLRSTIVFSAPFYTNFAVILILLGLEALGIIIKGESIGELGELGILT